MKKLWLVLGAVAVTGIALLSTTANASSGKYNVEPKDIFNYKVTTVNDSGVSGKRIPMVIAFHSAGANLTTHDILVKRFKESQDKEFRLVTIRGSIPKAAGSYLYWNFGPTYARESEEHAAEAAKEWVSLSEELAQMVAFLTRTFPTRGKPILTGSSQGGQVSLLLASRFPAMFQGVVAVSAYLLPSLWDKSIPNVTLIHGDVDDVVPLVYTSEYAKFIGVEVSVHKAYGHATTEEMRSEWAEAVAKEIGIAWKEK